MGTPAAGRRRGPWAITSNREVSECPPHRDHHGFEHFRRYTTARPVRQEVVVDRGQFFAEQHAVVTETRPLGRDHQAGRPQVAGRKDGHDHHVIARPIADIGRYDQHETRLMRISWLAGRVGEPDLTSARPTHGSVDGLQTTADRGLAQRIPRLSFVGRHRVGLNELRL